MKGGLLLLRELPLEEQFLQIQKAKPLKFLPKKMDYRIHQIKPLKKSKKNHMKKKKLQKKIEKKLNEFVSAD